MRIEEGFQQPRPVLPPTYSNDPALQALLNRLLPEEHFRTVDEELKGFERRLQGPIRTLSSRIDTSPAYSIEPTLTQYDQYGHRIDQLETSEPWRELKKVAVEEGLVAIPFERKEGRFSRVRSFAKAYLFAPDGLYVGCPISMTDGAARVIELAGTEEMKRDILPRLCSRDPSKVYIAGQWMTERTGGSDVGLTETVAHPLDPSRPAQVGDTFILDGFKWFSSATDGDVALALARTGSIESKSRGLSLFLVKLRNEDGTTNGIYVHRLKKKFGTKALPTAELSLSNCRGQLIGELGAGVRIISTVLNITRLWSAISCTSSVRRALDLARSFARVRHIGGDLKRLLSEDSIHTNALAKSEIVSRALLHLCFGTISLLGRSEARDGDDFEEGERWRLRLMTPVVKTFCAELSTTELPRLMESLGGQGYMSENSFGRLIADGNVERIWEGTTSTLSLDVVRVILQSKGTAVKHFVEWSRSTVSTSTNPVVTQTHQHRLNLLETVSNRFVSRTADPRLTRPLLFLLGYIASTINLVEQATWSSCTNRPEADLDRYIVERWMEDGGAKETVETLERILSEGVSIAKETMAFERELVYGNLTKL